VTYEREAIVRWLASHRTDPSTKLALRRRHLAPNLALRSAIEGWAASEALRRRAPATAEALAPACLRLWEPLLLKRVNVMTCPRRAP
jgi:DNA-binding FadR family transcriptional regulator